jgi:hypothetical protein
MIAGPRAHAPRAKASGRRSVSCIALQHGALLARVSRAQFLEFVVQRPEVLALYLQQGIARLWRVAHFVISDFLQFPRLTQTSNALVSSVDAFSPWADSSTRTAQQVEPVPGDAKSSLGDVKSSLGDAKRARWVTLRARWVTLRARWVTLRELAG